MRHRSHRPCAKRRLAARPTSAATVRLLFIVLAGCFRSFPFDSAMSFPPSILEKLLRWPAPPDFPCDDAASELDECGIKIVASYRLEFDNLLLGLRNRMTRLRFAQLEFPDHDDAEDDWSIWFEPLEAWADKFCLEPGGCRLYTQVFDITEGALMYFVIGDADGLGQTTLFHDIYKVRPYIDFRVHCLCVCTAISCLEGYIDWVEWDRTRHIGDGSNLDNALYTLVRRCEAAFCCYGLLTDGTRTMFVEIARICDGDNDRKITCQIFDCTEYSLAFCIAAIILLQDMSDINEPPVHSGALHNKIWRYTVDPTIQTFTSCRDFDLYAMQHSEVMYKQFLHLHAAARANGLKVLPRVGSEFSFVGLNIVRPALPPDEGAVPLSLPVEVLTLPARRANDGIVPLSPETDKAIFQNIALRPLNADVMNAITIHGTELKFLVRSIRQAGDRRRSQVYVGQLLLDEEILAGGVELCVKLFDERFYPIESVRLYRDYGVRLIVGDEMLVREESAYDRLKVYQGRLLPYFYGAHEFSLPDGSHVVGILMEYIQGENFDQVVRENRDHWTRDEKTALLKQVRHISKALLHSGVNQHDWRLKQLLCRPKDPDNSDRIVRADSFDLVAVDFAGTTQLWGCEEGAMLPQTPEVWDLCSELQKLHVPAEAFREAEWDEPDECEVFTPSNWIFNA